MGDQSTEIYPEITVIMKLVERDVKRAIMWSLFSKKGKGKPKHKKINKSYKIDPKVLSRYGKKICEVKRALDVVNSRSDSADKKISER